MTFNEQNLSTPSVPNNYVYLILLQVLMEGGCAIIGSCKDAATGEPFVTFEECREYVIFVCLKACPLTGPLQLLEKITKANEHTRFLRGASMRGGATFSAAMKADAPEVHALWLWVCETEVREAREVVESPSEADTPFLRQLEQWRLQRRAGVPPEEGPLLQPYFRQWPSLWWGSSLQRRPQGRDFRVTVRSCAQYVNRGAQVVSSEPMGQPVRIVASDGPLGKSQRHASADPPWYCGQALSFIRALGRAPKAPGASFFDGIGCLWLLLAVMAFSAGTNLSWEIDGDAGVPGASPSPCGTHGLNQGI